MAAGKEQLLLPHSVHCSHIGCVS